MGTDGDRGGSFRLYNYAGRAILSSLDMEFFNFETCRLAKSFLVRNCIVEISFYGKVQGT
jgi:hypothetical protein